MKDDSDSLGAAFVLVFGLSAALGALGAVTYLIAFFMRG